MVHEYKQIIDSWTTVSSVLSPPDTDADLDRLIEFTGYLIDEIGANEDHPLMGMLHIAGTLIEGYESQHFPEPESDPIERLKYLMQEHGLKQKDLTEIGSPGVISEVLSGKRELNKRQIEELSKKFGCSPAVFFN